MLTAFTEAHMTQDPRQIEANSEHVTKANGGETPGQEPITDPVRLRTQSELVSRALIVNAMFNISIKAPIAVIREWIERHHLTSDLSGWERLILAMDNADLTESDIRALSWYIEALWTLMWAGCLIDDLPMGYQVEQYLPSLIPDLSRGEGIEKLSQKMKLRPYDELYAMLRLYQHGHWIARAQQLTGQPPSNYNIDVIAERRRALEWLLDPDVDWHDTDMST